MTIHRAERPYNPTESPPRGQPPYRNGHATLDWLHPHEAAARLSPGKWRKDGPHSAYAQCPCHADDSPSLHLTLKNDALLVHCFPCGADAQDAIVAALAERGLAVFPPKDDPIPKPPEGVRTKVTTYLYHHADGSPLYRKHRYEWRHNGKRVGDRKTYLWERLDAGNWCWGLNEQQAPLYRLPELLAAPDQPIHFCEGEKCADAVARLGLIATTLPSQKLEEGADLSPCAGRVIYNHADNDQSGRDQAAVRADALRAAGAEKIVHVTYEDCGHKGDVADWLASDGVGLEEFLQRCEAAEVLVEQKPAAALRFDYAIAFDPKVDATVKGILHPGDVAALWGQSGLGKTFVALDLAYHVAHGRTWHGRRVRPAAVLYVALEGERGLENRMLACIEQFGSAGKMMARLTIQTPLDKSETGLAGENAIIAQTKLLAEAAGTHVGLIVIDTLSRAIAGDDENSAQDMSAYIGRIKRIGRATGAAVLSVHHPGKDEGRGMRGSNSLFAACDTIIKDRGQWRCDSRCVPGEIQGGRHRAAVLLPAQAGVTRHRRGWRRGDDTTRA